MKEATLLTSGKISMLCRSLEVSCRPRERSVLGNASCPFKTATPLTELILPPEKAMWGDRERSGWVGGGGPIADLGHGIYRGPLGRSLCRLDARGQWIVKWVSLEPFTSRHVPKCFAGTAPSLQVQPRCCWLQPRRDRGSVCVTASVPSLSVYCSLWGALGLSVQPGMRHNTPPRCLYGGDRGDFEHHWMVWGSQRAWTPRSSFSSCQGWHQGCL